jgi:hypothetical protein
MEYLRLRMPIAAFRRVNMHFYFPQGDYSYDKKTVSSALNWQEIDLYVSMASDLFRAAAFSAERGMHLMPETWDLVETRSCLFPLDRINSFIYQKMKHCYVNLLSCFRLLYKY